MSIQPEKAHRTGNLSPEFVLLGFLVAGPCHGYDLHQRFTAELGQVWHLSQSQAYAILNRLEHRGDISVKVIRQHKLPDKQMLRITAAGRHRFRRWLESGISTNARGIRLEFLTRLYFSNLYSPQDTARIYATQYAEIQNNIERLEARLARIPDEQTYNRLSMDLRLRQLKLIQEWMVEIKAKLHIPSEVIA